MTNSVESMVRDLYRAVDEQQEHLLTSDVIHRAGPVRPLEERSSVVVPSQHRNVRVVATVAVAALVVFTFVGLPALFGAFSDAEVSPASEPSTTEAPTTTASSPTTTIAGSEAPLFSDLPSASSAGWTVLVDAPSYRQEIAAISDGEVVPAGAAVSGLDTRGQLVTVYQGFDCLDDQNNAYLNPRHDGYGIDCTGELVVDPQLVTAERSDSGFGFSFWDAPEGQIGLVASVQVGIPLAWRCDTTVALASSQCTLMLNASGTWIDADIPSDDAWGFVNGRWLRAGDTVVVYQRDKMIRGDDPWWISHDGGATFASTPEPPIGSREPHAAPFVQAGEFRSIRWGADPGSAATLWTLQGDSWVQTADTTGLPAAVELCIASCSLEPTAVGTIDGSVILVLLTVDRQASYLRSVDNGQTWEELEPFQHNSQDVLLPGIVTDVGGWASIKYEPEIVVTDGTDWYRLDAESWRTTQSVADGITRRHPIPPRS